MMCSNDFILLLMVHIQLLLISINSLVGWMRTTPSRHCVVGYFIDSVSVLSFGRGIVTWKGALSPAPVTVPPQQRLPHQCPQDHRSYIGLGLVAKSLVLPPDTLASGLGPNHDSCHRATHYSAAERNEAGMRM